MVIVISSQGDNLNSQPSLRFGRAPFFIKYETEDDTWEALQNYAAFESGGAGVAASQTIIDNKAHAAISGSFGPNANRALASAGIKMLTIDGSYTTVEQVVEDFKFSKLQEVPRRGSFL
jgi:predicted Fe-Mo cluster-binding NifX family protein